MATGEAEHKTAASFQAAQKLDLNDGEIALNLGLTRMPLAKTIGIYGRIHTRLRQWLPENAEVWFRKGRPIAS